MTTFKKAPLALAITALMATPYALADGVGNGFIGGYNTFDTDSRIDADFDNRIDVELRHDSDTYKDFYVNVGTFDPARHYSGATVDSEQLIHSTGVANWRAENNATLNGDALKGASGNVGINVAAGDSNSQANDAALSASDAERVFGQAAAFSAQSSSNAYVASAGSPNNATLAGYALQGTTGNIGVNVAAGVGNAQQNSLAASSNTRSGSADATTGGVQTAYNNLNLGFREAGLMAMGGTLSNGVTTPNSVYLAAENNATLGDYALLDASGNIGVNVAAGNNNLQRNSLAIASATGGSQ